jgi:outer membrane receptor for ferrienterochelin and colicins
MFKFHSIIIAILLFSSTFTWQHILAQNAILSGTITSNGETMLGARIYIEELQLGAISDQNGFYQIDNIRAGKYEVLIRSTGYITTRDSVQLESGSRLTRNYEMQEDILRLGDVVVTGTRSQIERHNSTVIVSTVSERTLESTQSISIADGLHFSPGLRVENNCQNCGFTQLRMNGLDGAYSQILINSRPVFSALAGVYGLEMLPANMVERIEVVRGGGSVLYGGNAIAGTVNIITKDPIENSFEIALNQSFINFEAPDRTITINGAVVNKKMDKGISFFGFNRTRSPWDANNDGFSEMVKMMVRQTPTTTTYTPMSKKRAVPIMPMTGMGSGNQRPVMKGWSVSSMGARPLSREMLRPAGMR